MKKNRRFRICEKYVMNSLKVDLGNVLDDPSTREFVCPYCSYSFAYKHVLERHVAQIHEKHLLTTLQCPKCTYSTVRKDQMRAHFSVVHEDFKPFNCSECGFRAPKAFRVTVNIEFLFILNTHVLEYLLNLKHLISGSHTKESRGRRLSNP